MPDRVSGSPGRATRISISIPAKLYGRLQALSQRQQRSLSNLCVVLLAEAVQQEDPMD